MPCGIRDQRTGRRFDPVAARRCSMPPGSTCTVTSEPTRSRSRWKRWRREISKATNATCHKNRGAASSSSNRPTCKTHTVSAPRATARASGITCVLLGPGPHRDRGGRCFVLPGLGFCEVAGLQVYGGRPCAGAGSDVRRLHKWLFDLGPQAKLNVLGVGVVLLYGKDLRTGNNAFYTDVTW